MRAGRGTASTATAYSARTRLIDWPVDFVRSGTVEDARQGQRQRQRRQDNDNGGVAQQVNGKGESRREVTEVRAISGEEGVRRHNG